MLEKLCGIYAPSGEEERVTSEIEKALPEGISYEYMRNGNLVVFKEGRKKSDKTLMVFAHTDEVGFIVTKITDEGYLKFDTVGGIDKRILLSKRVFVGEKSIPGIIGVRAVHLTSREERKKSVPMEEMYIDIGASSREDALKYVMPGDYASFEAGFTLNGKRMISKAFDDRAGVATLLRLVNSETEYGFIACFGIGEEIGLKGAETAANKYKPHYGLILEGTTCQDVNGTPEEGKSTRLGEGPAVSIRDFGSCSDREFNSFIFKLAKENNLKYQLKRTHRGGNDARVVQLAGSGVKTAVISVPVRYIHSPSGIMDSEDFENAFKLTKTIADNIGEI